MADEKQLRRARRRLAGGARDEVGDMVRVPRAAVRFATVSLDAGAQAIQVLAQQLKDLRVEKAQLEQQVRDLEQALADCQAQLP